MLEVIPENIEGAIVCNIVGSCEQSRECEDCLGLVVGIHNWLVATEQKYIVFDFQDEKELCPCFIEELVQLRKRMGIPFFFTGIMERAKQFICSFDYTAESIIFRIPEDAIDLLKTMINDVSLDPKIPMTYGEPISLIRSRYSHKMDLDDGAYEAADL